MMEWMTATWSVKTRPWALLNRSLVPLGRLHPHEASPAWGNRKNLVKVLARRLDPSDHPDLNRSSTAGARTLVRILTTVRLGSKAHTPPSCSAAEGAARNTSSAGVD